MGESFHYFEFGLQYTFELLAVHVTAPLIVMTSLSLLARQDETVLSEVRPFEGSRALE